ncbi:MAG: arginine decarboxylase, pyruvoyl-dependent [Synergistales bacterium]|nr:arginine decarboxylase, pyruvoyl-dependent [Synergistales bacterium]
MLPVPTQYTLVIGKGEAETELTAFDAALLDARIGNMNLLRVSSVLPPGCLFVSQFDMPLGSLLPVAYGSLQSTTPGETIAAGIGVGVPEDSGDSGMIMEFSGRCSADRAAIQVEEMVREAFSFRGIPLGEVKVKSIEHTVEHCGCVIAACPLFYR